MVKRNGEGVTPSMMVHFFEHNMPEFLTRIEFVRSRDPTSNRVRGVGRRRAKGEAALVLAVVSEALSSAYNIHSRSRRGEFVPTKYGDVMFFRDGTVDNWVSLIGLNPDFVRESLNKVFPWIYA